MKKTPPILQVVSIPVSPKGGRGGPNLTPKKKNGIHTNGKATFTLEKIWEIGQLIPPPPPSLPEPNLSDNAFYIGKTRYAKRDEAGEPVESAKEMFWRVAYNIAVAELQFDTDKAHMMAVAREFYSIMATQQFIPNTPTMLNAGKRMQQLSACFVLPIEDDMRSIAKTMVDMVMIHKSGGGTGFSFSRLRPYGDVIGSSGGTTVGPCSFLQAYNDVTSQIKQGGVRRGANMGILHITHPDVLRFAVMKVDEFSLTNFNISVTVTEEWMEQVKKDEKYVESEPDWEEVVDEIKAAQAIRDVDLKLKKVEDGVVKLYDLVRATHNGEGYELINPRSGEVTDRLNAKKVFLLITQLAWHYGDPGMIMIDRINSSGANPTPHLGMIEATNPCGEQPLLGYDACTLGSINVGLFVKDGAVDYQGLAEVSAQAIHFLDNVLDMNNYPIQEISDMTRKIRRVGLGVMGFADLLYKLGVGYNSEEGRKIAEQVMACIQKAAKEASVELAKVRGSFPAWSGSIFDPKSPYFLGEDLKVRNGAVTTIAPTGTISMLADASSGIEPIFGLSYAKNTIEGKRLFNTNPIFMEVAKKEGFYSQELLEKIEANHGSVKGLPEVPSSWQEVFVVAHDIAPDDHVRMQAAFQKQVDNAISKTINFAHEATVEDVRRAYMMVYETGCKGITIYRDGSREKQILEVKKEGSYYDQLAGGTNFKVGKSDEHLAGESVSQQVSNSAESADTLTPTESGLTSRYTDTQLGDRPVILRGRTYKIMTPVGEAFITINRDSSDHPFEVFITIGKAGMHTGADAEAIGRLISLALRISRPNSKEIAKKVISQLKGIGGASQIGFGKDRVMSLADAIAKALAEDLALNGHSEAAEAIPLNLTVEDAPVVDLQALAEESSADFCPECGVAAFVFVEGCQKCYSCGYSKC